VIIIAAVLCHSFGAVKIQRLSLWYLARRQLSFSPPWKSSPFVLKGPIKRVEELSFLDSSVNDVNTSSQQLEFKNVAFVTQKLSHWVPFPNFAFQQIDVHSSFPRNDAGEIEVLLPGFESIWLIASLLCHNCRLCALMASE